MKPTILFIDDDPVALKLVVDTFKNHLGAAFKYLRASHAEEAEEILTEELTDKGVLPVLIVCDWILPGKRGDHFLDEIGDMYPEINLVLHSGLSDAALEARLKESCNLVCSLRKPWDGQQHLDAIKQVLDLQATAS